MSDAIPRRLAKLSQLVSGRSCHQMEQYGLTTMDGLLDALLVLYEECTNENLAKKTHIGDFVKKRKITAICFDM